MAVNGYSGAAYKSFNSWITEVASMFSDEDLDVRKVICTTGLPQRVLS
jgi:viroplasmin and RNaseH domain-containing protein